jgi:hypothetical protein
MKVTVMIVAVTVILAGASASATTLYWTPAHYLAPSGYLLPPTACDLDGDGDYDVTALDARPPYHYWNVGTPQMPAWQLDMTQFTGIINCSIIGGSPGDFGDLDGDGDQDLVFGCFYGDLHMNWNVGTPQVPAWLDDPSMFQGLAIHWKPAPLLADLDADGDLDLLIVRDDFAPRYLENTGSPTSPQWTDRGNVSGITFAHPAHVYAALGDLDGDGDLDMVGSCYGPNIQCWENVGTPQGFQFVENPSMLIGVVAPQGYGLDLLDIDADGDPDLLFGGAYFVNYLYLNERVSPVEARTWGSIKALYR